MKPNRKCQTLINLETKCRTFEKPKGTTNAGTPLDASMCRNDGWLVIHNSEIMSGVIDKAIIGDGNKHSMFYIALRDYGPDVAADYMNRKGIRRL